MEVPRCMLAIAGHFPGAGYVDNRNSATPADSDANLGRMPLLRCGAGVIGQSGAINHYVATVCGLMGSSPFEAAAITAFAEHMRELNTDFRALVPYGTEPSAAALDTFFNDASASDYAGPADGAKRSSRHLKWCVGGGGAGSAGA